MVLLRDKGTIITTDSSLLMAEQKIVPYLDETMVENGMIITVNQ